MQMNLMRQTAESSAASPPLPLGAGRVAFIDNVRWAMIVLVLSMHAAVTYSPLGSWYYREHPTIGPASQLAFATWQAVLQGFFMALLFFVAGVFAYRSCETKGSATFFRGRLARLGLPTLLFVVAVGPLTDQIVTRSWPSSRSLLGGMEHYVLGGGFLSATGPMWFCVALLGFSAGYAVLRGLTGRDRAPSSPVGPVTARGVAMVAAGIAATTFLVRLAFPIGSAVLNLQLCFFPSYVTMFALGIAGGRAGWLRTTSDEFCLRAGGLCVGVAMLAWLPLLVFGGALASDGAAAFSGGWTWQSAAMSGWEALICVGMSLLVLAGFRRWLSGQGRLTSFLSDNAFAVYVLHPPVLVGLAVLAAPLALPALVKALLLWIASAALCFGLVAPACRRLPGLRGVLQ